MEALFLEGYAQARFGLPVDGDRALQHLDGAPPMLQEAHATYLHLGFVYPASLLPRLACRSAFSMPTLASPSVLVFLGPLAFAVLLWLVSLSGALGHGDGFDGHDAHADEGGGLADLFGGLPLSLGVTLLLAAYGLAGLVFRLVLGWGAGLSVALAVAVGLLVTRLGARALAPLFRSEAAPGARGLVGAVATVTSGAVDERGGTAIVRHNGVRLDVPVRLDPDVPADRALTTGDAVLLFDFDAARNVYLVVPHDPDGPPAQARSLDSIR